MTKSAVKTRLIGLKVKVPERISAAGYAHYYIRPDKLTCTGGTS